MITARVAAMITLVLTASCPAAADCIGSTLPDHKRRAAFVFEGTVRELMVLEGNEKAALIETHRVWKGKVTTLVSVHFVSTSEGPFFTVGNRYVILGVLETEGWRKVGGLPSGSHDGTIWVNPCSGPLPASPELIKQLGRSRKPSSRAADGDPHDGWMKPHRRWCIDATPLLLWGLRVSTPAQSPFENGHHPDSTISQFLTKGV
jgi:hypothetical protein